MSVLAEIDAAETRGQVGEIMRREGLLISEWRDSRERGALEAMSGRKSDLVAAENARLRQQVGRLEAELATAGS